MDPNRDNGRFLPPGWERAYDSYKRKSFYVDHNTKTTTWLSPLDLQTRPKSFSECSEGQLPYGWEEIKDPVIGIYYTDHIKRKNQWTNPVSDWRISNQHTYSNSYHILSQQQQQQQSDRNSLESNTNQSISTASALSSSQPLQILEKPTIITTTSRPEAFDESRTSLQCASSSERSVGKSATSLNNSTNLDSEIVVGGSSSSQSNNSTRNSKYDEGLLNIMDNCFGRESSQSVEV